MGILDSLESSGILGQLGAAVLPAVLGEVLGTGNQGGAHRDPGHCEIRDSVKRVARI